MRPIERIDNFVQKINWYKLFYNRWKLSTTDVYKVEHERLLNIIKYWKENPDQRIGQVLINLELVPDNLTIWNDEEFHILKSQGYPLEECLYWTSVLDKDGNTLEKPITRLVADLDKDHIRNIKNYFNKHQAYLPSHYVEAFNNVLNK